MCFDLFVVGGKNFHYVVAEIDDFMTELGVWDSSF